MSADTRYVLYAAEQVDDPRKAEDEHRRPQADVKCQTPGRARKPKTDVVEVRPRHHQGLTDEWDGIGCRSSREMNIVYIEHGSWRT